MRGVKKEKKELNKLNICLQGWPPSKKNSKQIYINRKTGKRFITASDNFKAWHLKAFYSLKKTIPTINTCKSITLTFYNPTKARYDLSNKTESVMDLLVDRGILLDDKSECTGAVTMIPGGQDKENPRVEIELEIID